MNEVSQRIKSAMKIRNMKQVDIVKQTGISKAALSSYLSNLYLPKEDTIKQIANALQVSPLWLKGMNVPMEEQSKDCKNGITETDLDSDSYVFYTELPLNYPDLLYVGSVSQNAALISSYYIYTNKSMNEMHVLPLFSFRENPAELYEFPQELIQSGKHSYFSLDFPTIGIELATAVIYYYGIDIEKSEPKITTLEYHAKDDRFVVDSGHKPELYSSFVRELQKELLYLNHKE